MMVVAVVVTTTMPMNDDCDDIDGGGRIAMAMAIIWF